jgi:hypothetical protein
VIFNKDVLICIIILFVVQIVIWFQLNAQVKWDWFKDNYLLMSILGIPISYALLYSTKYGYIGFGNLWSIRLLGFAVGMITFPFITYMILGEGITLKTGISILLAIGIMLLQLI